MKTPHTLVVMAVLPVLLVGCVCGGTHQSAGTKPAKLEMKVTLFSLDEEKFGNKKEKQVVAEIRNIGETTVLLPTKEIGPVVRINSGLFYSIDFSTDWYLSTRDGFKIPKAKSELAIVELRPREAIMLDCTLDGTNVSPARVNVEYKISKEFAERYGTWHGEIGSKPVQSK
jgi:hypothetical protein